MMKKNLKTIAVSAFIGLGSLVFNGCQKNKTIYDKVKRLIEKNNGELKIKNQGWCYEFYLGDIYLDVYLEDEKNQVVESFHDYRIDGIFNSDYDQYTFLDSNGETKEISIYDGKKSQIASARYDSLMKAIPKIYKENKKRK